MGIKVPDQEHMHYTCIDPQTYLTKYKKYTPIVVPYTNIPAPSYIAGYLHLQLYLQYCTYKNTLAPAGGGDLLEPT